MDRVRVVSPGREGYKSRLPWLVAAGPSASASTPTLSIFIPNVGNDVYSKNGPSSFTIDAFLSPPSHTELKSMSEALISNLRECQQEIKERGTHLGSIGAELEGRTKRWAEVHTGEGREWEECRVVCVALDQLREMRQRYKSERTAGRRVLDRVRNLFGAMDRGSLSIREESYPAVGSSWS
ncbi:hypothetical protein IAT38_006039 [Cryptococcus sp. DSM 104549]